MSNINFIALQNACRYQGLITEGRKMCGFKNGKTATCWADWTECCSNNCYLIQKKTKNELKEKQITMEI